MLMNKWVRCGLVLAICFLGLFSGANLLAKEQIIEIKEKYSRDVGGYRKGKYGESLWVCCLDSGPEYPVIFPNKEVREGTIFLWFKPTRQDWFHEFQRFVKLDDGKQAIRFDLCSGGRKRTIPPRRLQVSISGIPEVKGTWYHASKVLSEEFHKDFHHLVYTWNENESKTYLDGKILGERKNEGKWFKTFNGTKMSLSLSAPKGIWFDELGILDKCITTEEVVSLYKRDIPWKPDYCTCLYIGFDKNLSGESVIRENGDTIRMISHIGHPEAMFRKNDQVKIAFTVINSSSENKELILHGEVKNLKREKVLEKSYPVKLKKGNVSIIVFDMEELLEKGLFWGNFFLEDTNGNILTKEMIPFAISLAVDVKSYSHTDIPTGLVRSYGMNSPNSEKWAGFEYESTWRNLEYAPGKWDFETLDMLVEDAMRTGRRPHLMLFGSPDWRVKRFPPEKYEQHTKRSFACPESIEAFKEYARLLGERYKGKVYDYEVWNEPYWNDPSGGYFYGTAEQYIELVRAAAEVLHQIDPRIEVCAGMGGPSTWQEKVAKGTAGYADYYGVHPYSLAKRLSDETSLLNTREILHDAGASERLANTEISDYSLLRYAIFKDGYPMTAEEFDKSGLWEKMSDVWRKQGREAFNDHYTSAASVVRSLVMSLAGGCEYFLWWTIGATGAWGSMTFEANTPSLPSVAYANASGILAGYKFVKRIDLGASYLKGYLFQKKNELILVSWADKDPESIYIQLGEGNVQILDTYGNPFSFEKFGPVIRTTLTMFPIYIQGFSQIPAGTKPILKAESVKDFVFPGEKCQIKVSMYNPLKQDVKGKLMLKLPESFPILPTKAVSLTFNETKDYLFEFKVPEGIAGTQKTKVNFFSSTKGLEDMVQYSFLAVRQNAAVRWITTPIQIDGNLKEWGNIGKFPIQINKRSQVVVGTPFTAVAHDPSLVGDWKGEKDLSAKASLAYDSKNLYIGIRVYDDILMNPVSRKKPPLSYEGDCVELFLDGRATEKQGKNYTQKVYQIFFVPGMEDFPAPIRHILQPREGRLVGMALNSTILEDGYSLEIRIPLSNFPAVNFKPGANVGFDIAIDDKDSKQVRGRKVQMVWAGTEGNYADASLFGRIIFK
jgi:hypothetical protein